MPLVGIGINCTFLISHIYLFLLTSFFSSNLSFLSHSYGDLWSYRKGLSYGEHQVGIYSEKDRIGIYINSVENVFQFSKVLFGKTFFFILIYFNLFIFRMELQ